MNTKKVIKWMIPGSTILLLLVPSRVTEVLYGQFLYPLVRLLFAPFSIFPFPILYILLIILVYFLIKEIRANYTVVHKVKNILSSLFIIICMFYFLWAINYKRIDFGEKFPLIQSKMDSMAWKEELHWSYDKLLTTRPLELKKYNPNEIENLVKAYVKIECHQKGYEVLGGVRVKALYPKGILLRIRTAGFYLPFAGEGYIDPGLHFIQKPFTLAHEMCHGYGVTDEGACNLLAYLALQDHPDSTIRYSAEMSYFRYVAGEFRFRFPHQYNVWRKNLNPMITKDLDDIYQEMLKYPDIFPKLRDNIYNSYLVMQGIDEGMESYNNIIGYVRMLRKDGALH